MFYMVKCLNFEQVNFRESYMFENMFCIFLTTLLFFFSGFIHNLALVLCHEKREGTGQKETFKHGIS